MTLLWIVIGTLLQLFLAFFFFMFTAFAGGGIANGNSLKPIQISILDMSIYVLPGLCVFSAGLVIVLYCNDASASAYWWYAVPVAGAFFYNLYLKRIVKR